VRRARHAPPPPESSPFSFELVPANPQPGEGFEALFDPSNSRGGFFELSRWDGSTWLEPEFLLESDARRGPPTATRLTKDEDWAVLDYGVDGPGPDGLVMPEEIEEGIWRLCIAGSGRRCVQLIVG
jgi:hypothetical protein